ncbi:unnamed protein product [Paramecium octaurelia]|uniref:Cullin family profile domain-containing protein n=1 Tax=Paramecium octaurelia TaxID=43137 RepID=A0A8S1UBZ2_PAROT|nr:unnamed protein product [Paramecium octaurelia]
MENLIIFDQLKYQVNIKINKQKIVRMLPSRSSLHDYIEETCTNILEKKEVPLQEKSRIDRDIDEYIKNQNNDQQQEEAKTFIKVAIKCIKTHCAKNILPKFQDKYKDALYHVETFLQVHKTFVKSVKSFKILLYQAAQTLQQESIPEFYSSLFDNIFVEEFQLVFKNVLFKCVVDMIKTACEEEQKLIKISDLLYEFGNVMSQLQKSTEEALDFKIEQEFKQKIFDYFEEKYQQNYKSWHQSVNTQAYLRKVQQQKEINEKVLKFGDKTILEQVNRILNSHLLTYYKPYLLADTNPNNFEHLLNEFHKEPIIQQQNLKLIGDLYGSLDDHYDQITTNFKNIITQEGQAIMQKKNHQIVETNQDQIFSDPSFIGQFYSLYQKYSFLIESCFSQKSDFIMALNNAFESFINLPIGNHEFADYLVTFIGEQIELLRNSPKNATKSPEQIVKLFVFINQKARFLKLYKISLAQRLIKYQRQVEAKKSKLACTIEMNIVEEMEKKCGAQDLESLKIMIKDFQKTENEVTKIQEEKGLYKLQIQPPIIINKQHWPEIDEIQLNLQSEIITQQKEIIAKRQQQKTLIWLDLISYVEIQSTEKALTFNLSVPQAVILLLYQYRNDILDVNRIASLTGLKEQYVIQNCKMMKDAKILDEQIVNDQICYQFNENLTKQKKGKCKKIVTETYFPQNQVEQVVSVYDKDLAIEAAIVKIMKKQKEMQFSDLVIQVQGHMKKNQNVEIPFAQIKQMIERLQRNEYLERDAINMQLIKYK